MTSSVETSQAAGTGHSPMLGRVVFAAAAAALGGFLFGYDSAVINGAVTGIQVHFKVSSGETGTVVAVALLGSALGAAIAGRVADKLGRLWVMHIAAGLFAVSAVGSSLPTTVWELGHLAGAGRHRDRAGVGHRADLYRRGRAARVPRPAGVVPADGHRARHHRLAVGQLGDRPRRGRQEPEQARARCTPGNGC